MPLFVKMRAWPLWLLALAAFAPALVLIPLARSLISIAPWLFPALGLLCAAWGILVTCQWWGKLDEPSQEAHKFAWFWGGSGGLSLVALSILLIEISSPFADVINNATRAFSGWRPGPAGFVTGVLACALVQMFSYLIVWAGWWIVRKAPR